MKNTVQTLAAFVFLAAIAVAIVWLEAGNETVLSGRPVVIDGDSLEINGERLRLQGIDAPELRQTCQRDGKVWPCGRESRAALRKLLVGKSVSCRTTGIDKYDRWLVECEADGTPLNETMVRQGWAVAFGDYFSAEEEAQDKKAGLWAGTFERPRQWRDVNRAEAASSPASALRNLWMRVRRLANAMFGL